MNQSRTRTTFTIAAAWILVLSTILTACAPKATPAPAAPTDPAFRPGPITDDYACSSGAG